MGRVTGYDMTYMDLGGVLEAVSRELRRRSFLCLSADLFSRGTKKIQHSEEVLDLRVAKALREFPKPGFTYPVTTTS